MAQDFKSLSLWPLLCRPEPVASVTRCVKISTFGLPLSSFEKKNFEVYLLSGKFLGNFCQLFMLQANFLCSNFTNLAKFGLNFGKICTNSSGHSVRPQSRIGL